MRPLSIYSYKKNWWRLNTLLLGFVRLAPIFSLLLVLPHSVGWSSFEFIAALDRRLHDIRLEWTASAAAVRDERIVIVDIDEVSLRDIGRWPWSRATVAALASELLQHQKAAVVGFDILFADSTTNTHVTRVQRRIPPSIYPSGQAEQLEQGDDAYLADTLRKQPVVLGFYVSPGRSPIRTGQLPPPVLIHHHLAHMQFPRLHQVDGYTGNIPMLTQAIPAAGFINAFSDNDGVLRSIPLVMRDRQPTGVTHYYVALSLRMLMLILGIQDISLQAVSQQSAAQEQLLQGIVLSQTNRDLLLPTAPNGGMLVPFRGKGGADAGRYQYISASDVLQGRLAPASLAGKLVLVGTSAPGLGDMRATPLDKNFPGVEVHAAMLSAMLDGRFYYQPDFANGYVVTTTLVAMLLLVMLLPRVRILGAFLLCFCLMAVMIGLNFWLYMQHGLALPVAATVLAIMLSYVLYVSAGFLLESRTKGQLVDLFGYYVPADLARRMAQSPETYSMSAQSQELSILFCDIQQFTQLSEHMAPEALQALLNQLFDHIAETIAEFNGTIDKYIGDCVMVFWGAPVADAEHAQHATEAALQLHIMLKQFNARQRKMQQPELHFGIGMNTGIVSVGDMGSSVRRSYTVIGDAVNVAARLEPLSKYYGLDIVAGARTRALATTIIWQWVDKVQLAGRRQPVDIYTPLGRQADSADHSQELTLWYMFYQAYGRRQWSECARLLRLLRTLFPDKRLYQIYETRIAQFCVSPPPSAWDGVSQMHNKSYIA